MRMFQMLLVVSSMALSAGAETQQELAARLVARYQEQVSTTTGLTYHFTHEGTSGLSRVFPPTRGNVKVVPAKAGAGLLERAHISAVSGEGDAARKIDVVVDGEVVRSLDAVNGRILSAPTWRNGIELVNFQYLMPLALVPELARLEPSDIHYKGEKTIGTKACVIIEADTQMANLTLFLGKDDAQLCGGIARKPEAWGDATIEMFFDQFKTGQTISDQEFRMVTPDGYSEVQYSGNFPILGEKAPGFKLTGFEGEPITLDRLAGRVVVLDFWATWCGPCKLAMPGLQQLHDRYASRGLTVIGVNYDERGDARAFLDRYKFTYTFASTEGSDIGELYKPVLPMAVVIDREGRMVEVFSGYFGQESDERLESLVKGLL